MKQNTNIMRYLFTLFLLSLSFVHFGQNFNVTYGGSFNEVGYCIRQTTDGGYLFLARDQEFDGFDFYYETMLVKTDRLGQEEWRKVYDDSLISQYSSGLSPTLDGGYIFINDYDIIKIDSLGNEEWTLDNDSLFRSVKQTTDSGYIYFGYKRQKHLNITTNRYVVLRKTDEQGIEEWYKTYNLDFGHYWVNGVKQTADGGYIMLGCTAMHNNGMTDVFLFKLDSQGDSSWVRTYGGGSNEWAGGVMLMKDGGYLVSSETNSYGNGLGGKSNAWLIRTNSVGDTLWTRTHGGISAEAARVQIQTNDG